MSTHASHGMISFSRFGSSPCFAVLFRFLQSIIIPLFESFTRLSLISVSLGGIRYLKTEQTQKQGPSQSNDPSVRTTGNCPGRVISSRFSIIRPSVPDRSADWFSLLYSPAQVKQHFQHSDIIRKTGTASHPHFRAFAWSGDIMSDGCVPLIQQDGSDECQSSPEPARHTGPPRRVRRKGILSLP